MSYVVTCPRCKRHTRSIVKGLCRSCYAVIRTNELRKNNPEWLADINRRAHKKYKQRNKEFVSELDREWKAKNKEKVKVIVRRSQLLSQYGLTEKDYEALLVAQNGVCAICGNGQTAKINGKTKPLFVDHCHNSLKVRGLLCHTCNRNLAVLDNADWVAKATVYLQQQRETETVNMTESLLPS